MRTVRISDEVWNEIAKRGKFGESVDDVLRRVFGLDSAAENEDSSHETHIISSPRTSGKRRKKATNRMSCYVSSGRLIVEFASGHRREFKLPDKSDKSGIRRIRDEACAFAEEHGATLGQVNAVRKALTDAGYYVSR